LKPFLKISAVIVLVVAIISSLLPGAKRKAAAIKCGSQMISICCAAQMWSGDNNNIFPANFVVMSNELNDPFILHCPSDAQRQPIRKWDSLTSENCSYEIVSTNLTGMDSNKVFIRCKIHSFVGLVNGSVFDGKTLLKKL
jgi:hypothetical protein